MKPRKTWDSLLAGRRAVPFDDFAQLLLAFGFQHKRTRGSHHIYGSLCTSFRGDQHLVGSWFDGGGDAEDGLEGGVS